VSCELVRSCGLRGLGAILLVSFAVVIATGVALAASNPSQSPIRVTLSAKNHQPRPSESPYKHWWYCVKVRTASGRSVASTIHVWILSGHTPVAGVGLVSLKKGYDHWCAAIGGEDSVLDAAPRGRKLVFQAVVKAKDVTVKRNWPIVIQWPRLSAHGIGGVPFGTAKQLAVRELSSLLGQSSRRFVSDGCGPNFTEVEWGHLYAEFRRDKFSGFRYMRRAWLPPGAVTSSAALPLQPKLTVSKRITLGSTLRQLRDRYGKLTPVGTDRWQNRDRLTFYVSFATNQPPPPDSRITEIKYGTCGDW
jgi:hypothetical protein